MGAGRDAGSFQRLLEAGRVYGKTHLRGNFERNLIVDFGGR